MGWCSDDHPEHEGWIVGLVPWEKGSALFRELSRRAGDADERTDISRIQAVCSCGWRSPYLFPLHGSWTNPDEGGKEYPLPRYSSGSTDVIEWDEERCYKLWMEHVEAARAKGGDRRDQ